MPRETFGLREEFLAVGPKSVCELKKSDSTWTVDKHYMQPVFFTCIARWCASHERQPWG